MENIDDRDNLLRFGNEFQSKCIAAILTNKIFVERIFDILTPDYFSSDANKWIVKEIMNYFLKYKSSPTLQVFAIQIDEVKNDVLKAVIKEQLKNIYQNYMNSTDLKYVMEQFLEFCKNQKMKNAIVSSSEHLKSGEYDKIRKVVDEALKAGMERNLGHEYLEDVEKRMSATCRDTIKTGWDVIDKLMDGGLAAGELAFVVAPSGSGKCVGPNTEIEIQYIENGVLITEKIKMINLFSKLKIEDKEDSFLEIPASLSLKVKTPYGFENIKVAFRTKKQKSIITYFKNNKTLKTSEEHLLKVNGEWKKVKDITKNDIIETETGTTSISKKFKKKEEILYDISVENVNCYYSNGILSHNSWILTRIGAEAMKAGKNVVHITLELNENYVGLRYDSCFTGINFQDIRKNVEVVKNKIDNISGKLFIKYYPIKTIAPYIIKMHVERIQMLTGNKIDLLVVDYADLLRPASAERNSNSYSEAGSVYEELRAVAGELQIPCWSASQSGRNSVSSDTIEAQHVADSYRKIMTGDFIIGLSRKTEDKVVGTARISIIKNRLGADGIQFPSYFDASNGNIKILDPTTFEGRECLNKIKDGDDIMNDKIKNDWEEIKKNRSQIGVDNDD